MEAIHVDTNITKMSYENAFWLKGGARGKAMMGVIPLESMNVLGMFHGNLDRRGKAMGSSESALGILWGA